MHIFFPSYLVTLLKRMGISLIILSICRFLFWLFNYDLFSQVSIFDFLWGIWFDMMTLGIVYIPYHILFLFPSPQKIREKNYYRIIFKLFFHVINSVLIFTNIIDIGYFKFTLKRSTYDLFSLVSYGNDLWNLIPDFIKDFWMLILIAFLLILLSEWLYRMTDKRKFTPVRWWHQSILFLTFCPLFFIMGRGGIQLKPRGIISAAQYTSADKISLVLNSTFTIIKSWGKPTLENKKYYTSGEAEKYFNPVNKGQTQGPLEGSNIVILVLESFTQEAIGTYGADPSHTPFLDSLFKNSLIFKKSYANGKKSIEAIPAITTGIPTLMDNPFISSAYANNQFITLTNILESKGYSSSFFHGATNGSMNFDGFAAWAGFEQYFGRTEYNNDKHYDGSWGIFDEYFLPWSVEKISSIQQPFFTTIFTISSHHPYNIPKHHRKKFNVSDNKLWNSIAYADYCIKLFFETCAKQKWFKNTLFIITSDHTPNGEKNYFKKRSGMYAIPLAFYHPAFDLKELAYPEKITQQADIPVSILDILGHSEPFYSFGKSVFDKKTPGFSISYMPGIYNFFYEDYLLLYDEGKEETHALYNLNKDSLMTYNIKDENPSRTDSIENILKAIIQTYNNAMIDNKMTIQDAKR